MPIEILLRRTIKALRKAEAAYDRAVATGRNVLTLRVLEARVMSIAQQDRMLREELAAQHMFRLLQASLPAGRRAV